jgi:hypothetical protein
MVIVPQPTAARQFFVHSYSLIWGLPGILHSHMQQDSRFGKNYERRQ